jgi:hypothetical protein
MVQIKFDKWLFEAFYSQYFTIKLKESEPLLN